MLWFITDVLEQRAGPCPTCASHTCAPQLVSAPSEALVWETLCEAPFIEQNPSFMGDMDTRQTSDI